MYLAANYASFTVKLINSKRGGEIKGIQNLVKGALCAWVNLRTFLLFNVY